jgi:bifunctional UDP-N-acetylglucosamine pyrophosphorylase / glucosamine-1-phosphate N-acetyltransferase
MPSVAAIVLAAGKGTRMKSALPKVLHPACGKPLVAWPVQACLDAGASPVVVVLGFGRELVEVELKRRFGDRAKPAVQAEQKGTGHAAQMALPALDGFSGTVLICYGDCPLLSAERLQALIDMRHRTNAPLALWTTRVDDPTGYGRIERDKDGILSQIVEQKDADERQRKINEINPGVYAVDAAWLRSALSQLTPNNAQNELYLTDLVAIARREAHTVPTIEVPSVETLGVNDRQQLWDATQHLQRGVIARAMRTGVTFLQPHTVLVDDTVMFSSDVVVGPQVVLSGATTVGENVHIGVGCVLNDTTIADGAIIHPYTVSDGAKIGPKCIVGPFARLRPGAVLEEGAHVGNYVELKKTKLGKGSKANHLAYLGDAEIGAGVNIGAGTITCNYDGIGKHPTTMGDDVFIGSNATLVAPLKIDKGAYVAAGSVVTREVPADSLAIARAKQENKDGYAAKIRSRNAARAKKK